MQPDKEGFTRPVVDRGKCIGCGACRTVCPAGQEAVRGTPDTFCAYSRDEEIRKKSSSGGVFTELAQQVQMLKENNLTKFSGVTIYDGIVIGDTAYYVMKQDFPEQEGMLGEMTAKRSWLGTWKFDSMGYGDSGINYDIIGCGGHNFLLLSGKDPEQQVAKVTLNWYGQTYEMTNESAKLYFLLCTELTGYMPDELLPSEDMFRFYDKNGKEIPRWYDSYSGSMNGSSIAVAQGSIYKAE